MTLHFLYNGFFQQSSNNISNTFIEHLIMKKFSFFLFLFIFSVTALLAQPPKKTTPTTQKPNNNGKPNFEGIQMCIDLPKVVQHIEDEDDMRVRGVASHRLWSPGQTLKVSFLEGDNYVQSELKNMLPNGQNMQISIFNLLIRVLRIFGLLSKIRGLGRV